MGSVVEVSALSHQLNRNTKMWKSVCLIALLQIASGTELGHGNRQGKLFFVSSSKSTTMTVETTMVTTSTTCYIVKSDVTTACKKRKRRGVIDEDQPGDDSDLDITVSRVTRDLDDVLGSEKAATHSSSREARFAWYYMTTTVTSTSTSTSTSSTAYSATVSVSLEVCTPADFNGCG